MHHTCRFHDHQTARCGRILQGKPKTIVGASLLAKIVNENASLPDSRAVLRFFACRLAPTG
ncbi:hypothetical protein DYL59_09055 [Pseudomonas kairouanensis]|uniref:Uncharacterized protein n=1 Tax=Pseudomonas kairouanensis TaxID=2293832 RepID=A0A4Z0AUY4_9PSED|nr:hypothetical protein DYL59_09055 [Pseudomonas kairouanensis]